MSEILFVCWNRLRLAIYSQKGQGMVEYGLILALVSVVAIAALTGIGTNIKLMFTNVAANI